MLQIVSWPFEDENFFQISLAPQDESVLRQHQEKVLTLKKRKNYASSSSGANIIYKSKGVFNEKAMLSSNSETYLTVPECNS